MHSAGRIAGAIGRARRHGGGDADEIGGAELNGEGGDIPVQPFGPFGGGNGEHIVALCQKLGCGPIGPACNFFSHAIASTRSTRARLWAKLASR